MHGIKVLRTPDRVLSDEVVRVVSQSPKWRPGYNGVSPVSVRFTLPVDFRVEE